MTRSRKELKPCPLKEPYSTSDFATLRWVDFFNNRRLLEPIDLLRTATEAWPDVVLAHVWLGDALVNLEKHDEAEASLRRALACDISGYLANLRYGQFLTRRRRDQTAKKYLNRVAAIDPTDDRARKTLEYLPR